MCHVQGVYRAGREEELKHCWSRILRCFRIRGSKDVQNRYLTPIVVCRDPNIRLYPVWGSYPFREWDISRLNVSWGSLLQYLGEFQLLHEPPGPFLSLLGLATVLVGYGLGQAPGYFAPVNTVH